MKNLTYLLLAFAIACSPSNQETEVHGIDRSNMDQTASPNDDFYQFANGAWLAKTEIPADKGLWGGFSKLAEETNENMLNILDEAIKSGKYVEGTDQKKAADFFSTGMDSLLAEKTGVMPIQDFIAKTEAASSTEELLEVIAELQVYGIGPFFGVGVFGDLMNSNMNALYLVPSGLGLPNKDYYTKDDDRSVEIRKKYEAHIARMLGLASDGQSSEELNETANRIMGIEYDLADGYLTPIEQRDLSRMYNPMDVNGLTEITPSVDWVNYFAATYVEKYDTIIVMQPNAMAKVEEVLTNSSLEDIKAYVKWNIINSAANYLNHDMVQANFDFYSKELGGVTEMTDRWKRVLNNTNGVMGEALGQLYVDAAFPPEAKAAAEEMVANVLAAMKARIENLEWMSAETKEQALKKLASTTVKIGYPDKWKDYSDLVVEASGETYSYYGNILNANKHRHMEDMPKIGKPVDKTEWGMSPQTVNAYYNPLNNEIVFPAAILQPPFYDYKADPAVNYGGMGAVIGHEISHGFDDQGSRFDADGNMVNWWTPEDKQAFQARTQVLVDQYNSYEVLDSVFVQGELTLGENIGDIAGLSVAYDAMQLHFQKHEKPAGIDGFTQEQRFFLSWATVWRTKYKDETLRTRVLTDPHSPGMYRAVGPLTNLETFYAAFDIKEGDKMWKPDSLRVKIW
jgi:putative endopeptidase